MHETTLDSCGCCEGSDLLTPKTQTITNPPGLPAIRFRAGTHGEFFETLIARLVSGAYPALRSLAARQPDDPSIALLDAWALVADILTFYNERLANEGFLRTAVERRSVLELARLVGYTLRPGVAASVWLAYILDDNFTEETIIPAGAAVQSVPGPGELPQTFECSEPLKARALWNNLKPRLLQPQSFYSITNKNQVYLKGISTNLNKNDMLMIDFFGSGTALAPYRVLEVLPDSAQDQTLVKVLPWLAKPAGAAAGENGVYDLGPLLEKLVQPAGLQLASPQRLPRSVGRLLEASGDASLRLLKRFQPSLGTSLKTALANAKATVSNTVRVYSMRLKAPIFGHNSPRQAQYNADGVLQPQPWPEWNVEEDEEDEVVFLDRKYPQILPGSFVALVQPGSGPAIFQDVDVSFLSRSAYGTAGESTMLTLPDRWWDHTNEEVITRLRKTVVYAAPEELPLAQEPVEGDICGGDVDAIELDRFYEGLEPGRWLIVSGERSDLPGSEGVMASELVMLADITHGVVPPGYQPPNTTPVGGVGGLATGMTVLPSGQTNTQPLPLPGDSNHTYLRLARPLAYCYKRQSVTIYANVVKATHGETRRETLGSGDGSKPLQTFSLKSPPLTFVPAPTPSGVESSLKVYVNNVEWSEFPGLLVLGPRDRGFITKTDHQGLTHLIFGNGERGARLPTGVENVRAVYRTGIGTGGNVLPRQISLLLTRPLGVKEVINPQGASGGAGPESRDSARKNVPLAVMALDRLVSVRDYADFARTFAGIGKGASARLSDGQRLVVHVTVAGQEDIPIDVNSDLYRSLRKALQEYGDPYLPVRVDVRELRLLVISAQVALLPGYLWEVVESQVRQALLATFGFEARELGQPAYLSEALAAMQGVPGVAYVDVDIFTGLPEKVTDTESGELRPILPEDFAALAATREDWVTADLASVKNGTYHPAQITCLPQDVPESVILNLLEAGA